ncbi:hypothetical protein BV20DRAFT_452243 [Pilatotrama ljubarskyi]|nr:hypothetical protein BV20DRAFT_452243 [Pilatotrama ljubarskyi]
MAATTLAADMDVTIGVILVGLAVTASLFGVSTAQAGWYFKHYRHDRTFLRVLVGLVWSLDICHLILYSITMWLYLAERELAAFGETALPWTSNVQILCNACVVFVIQTFYAFRIMTLSRSLRLTAALAAFVLADFGLAVTLFVKSLMTDTVSEYIQLEAFDIALSTLTAATDVLLSGTLVTLLARSRTGSSIANRLINRLLFYTINTGLLTSLCAVLSLIMVLVSPTTSIYVMFYYIGAHLYSVSLLATLNARAGLRADAEDSGYTTALSRLRVLLHRLPSRGQESKHPRMWGRANTPLSPGIVVAIHRDTTITFDDEGPKTLEIGMQTFSGTPSVSLERVHVEQSSEDSIPEMDPTRLAAPSPFF